ncbi:MAG TPA: aminotransferase class I/II-fold pyridoxal phosphate-dependent enzyme [Lacipirellulaceae bacterium]|nr:aminotransferase class I/II-fold pyridoxal phosphate-dependent enzyme [Lacipirellulaceae bacterium]
MTGRVDHERAPIFETLVKYADSGMYGFHTPGHKSGRFVAPELAELVGGRGLVLDLPSMTATDNTFHPTGCVRDAQQLAADLFGAGATFFLTAGSTLGVAAAMLASVAPGETVAMPRNVHRSVVAALVLSGALPIFVPHDVLPECGALGVTPTALAAILDSKPRPAAVLLTRPSYYGIARKLDDVADVCHARGLPLIVDEAHGGHFRFLPPTVAGGLEPGCNPPQPALAAGGDLVVQSCHKTLGSLVGSAQLHVGRKSLVEAEHVQHALNFLQTTSPSNLLLASLDVMRRWLWRKGETMFAKAVDDARKLAADIHAVPGLNVFGWKSDPKFADHRHDPLRLVVNVSGAGWSGYDVERYLRTEFQVEDEMADWFNVVYVLSPHDDPRAKERLIAGLRAVGASPKSGASRAVLPALGHEAHLLQPPIPPLAMSPRDAALAMQTPVPRDAATGRTCAEMVMFYPPGIPLLMPGEVVAPETLDICQRLLAAGAHPYASDPTLETIRVVA